MSIKNITKLHGIIERSLFQIDPPLDYGRTTDAFITLAKLVLDYAGEGEDIWYIGENSTACLDDMIIGGYWHFNDWHAGQYSKSYAALCALGNIYFPNMDTVALDNEAYFALNELAENSVNK